MDVMEKFFAVYGVHVQAYLRAECGPSLRRVLDIPAFGGSSTWLFFRLCPRLSPDRTVQRITVSAALCPVALSGIEDQVMYHGLFESNALTRGAFTLQPPTARSRRSGQREENRLDSFHRVCFLKMLITMTSLISFGTCSLFHILRMRLNKRLFSGRPPR